MQYLSSFSLPPQPSPVKPQSNLFFRSRTPTLFSLSLMADNHPICLLRAMDRLWFHQIILLSEPALPLLPKILKPPHAQFVAESPLLTDLPSNMTSQSTLPDDKSSSIQSANFSPRDDTDNEDDEKERPTRLELITSKTRSNSSSPMMRKSSKKLRYLGSARKLQKTMSCRSLLELELEEVKGFMDLGFTFNKEHMCPRMMSVLPGLQRLRVSKCEGKPKFTIDVAEEIAKDDEYDDNEEEDKKGVMRPYLSEAWLIKRPDSPLLNLRIPEVSSASDMKKHLRYWARTVASVIQQES